MIPYADLDRALKRWKARSGGGDPSGAAFDEAMAEVTPEVETIGVPQEISPADEPSSGMVIGDDDVEPNEDVP